METDILTVIKESFEKWYNASRADKVSILINYNDLQTASIRAYHKTSIKMQAISIVNGKSLVRPLISLAENYNHGVTTEQEAKENMIRKLLNELYGFSRF